MAATRTQITPAKFHSINRQIKALNARGIYNALQIAQTEHVSRETVNSVKRLKTWPAWQRAKAAKRVERADKQPAVVPTTKPVASKPALPPVTHQQVRELHARIDALEGRVTDIHSGQSVRTKRRIAGFSFRRNFGR